MAAIKDIDNDHAAHWHHDKFIDFARAKAIIGEPTPHMRVVDYLCKDVSDEERIWRAGCYLAGYSVITGEGIWSNWSWKDIRRRPRMFSSWLVDNWAGIHTRKPRRCVRTPAQFSKCVLGYADWAADVVPRLRSTATSSPEEEYNLWWKSAETIPYFGRYISIRLLECFRRWKYLTADLYDIRAVGAHSPIRCLMLLRPDSVEELRRGEPVSVNRVAFSVKRQLFEAGVDLSYFTYATLLCEYRGCYEDGGDYAGNQHDEELEYSLSRFAQHWERGGLESRLYEARAAIDPHECLGELQGWTRRRTDVAKLMRATGLVWSDLTHDYVASLTKGYLDVPVLRQQQGSLSSQGRVARYRLG